MSDGRQSNMALVPSSQQHMVIGQAGALDRADHDGMFAPPIKPQSSQPQQSIEMQEVNNKPGSKPSWKGNQTEVTTLLGAATRVYLFCTV